MRPPRFLVYVCVLLVISYLTTVPTEARGGGGRGGGGRSSGGSRSRPSSSSYPRQPQITKAGPSAPSLPSSGSSSSGGSRSRPSSSSYPRQPQITKVEPSAPSLPSSGSSSSHGSGGPPPPGWNVGGSGHSNSQPAAPPVGWNVGGHSNTPQGPPPPYRAGAPPPYPGTGHSNPSAPPYPGHSGIPAGPPPPYSPSASSGHNPPPAGWNVPGGAPPSYHQATGQSPPSYHQATGGSSFPIGGSSFPMGGGGGFPMGGMGGYGGYGHSSPPVIVQKSGGSRFIPIPIPIPLGGGLFGRSHHSTPNVIVVNGQNGQRVVTNSSGNIVTTTKSPLRAVATVNSSALYPTMTNSNGNLTYPNFTLSNGTSLNGTINGNNTVYALWSNGTHYIPYVPGQYVLTNTTTVTSDGGKGSNQHVNRNEKQQHQPPKEKGFFKKVRDFFVNLFSPSKWG